MTPRFLAMLNFTLSWECVFAPGHDGDMNYVVTENDPDDPGGLTKFGIDQADHPGVDVANLTLAQAQQIYFDGEWTLCQCGQMPAGLGEFLFDSAVNVGCFEAVKFLQEALGVAVDGFLGPVTLAAAQALTAAQDLADIVADFNSRKLYYARLAQQDANYQKFLAGWDNRIAALDQFCQSLVEEPPMPSTPALLHPE